MEVPGSRLPWRPSNMPLSFSSGGMDDLPFSLEDLPPEIRGKIDDIIEKNEDLDSQLEAIDELLFARKPLAKFDYLARFDIGSESGIGSDSDSGNGILPSTDPLNSSSASSTFSRPPDEDLGMNPKTFGPPRRTLVRAEHEVDDFISQLIIPPPPSPSPSPSFLNSPSNSETRGQFVSGIHRSSSSSLLPMGLHQQNRSTSTGTIFRNNSSRVEITWNDSIPPVAPQPSVALGFMPGKDPRGAEDKIRVVRNSDEFHVTPNVPQGPRSTPSPSPREEELSSSVSRMLVAAGEVKVPSEATANRTLNENKRFSQAETTDSRSLKSNTHPMPVSLSRSTSRTELYAWEGGPEFSISSQSTTRSPKSSKSEISLPTAVPDVGQGVLCRHSQLSPESFREAKMSWKKDEPEGDSVRKYISSPSRYSKSSAGSTVDIRRKKSRPSSGILSKAKAADPKGSKWNSESRPGTWDDGRSDLKNTEEEKTATASDDDFSSLVQLRGKNGKPAQMMRIDQKTMKAHSMLSLYDPSSDVKEKSKGKKSDKKEIESTPDSKKRLSGLFQGKAKFNNKSKDGKTRQSNERTDSRNGIIFKADSESELHRSDYLCPTVPFVSIRNSIPSPSLYSSTDTSVLNSNLKTRPLSGPSCIPNSFRIDARDLSVDDDRPPVTFSTFRGQIEPIRWREEKANNLSRTNRLSHVMRSSVELSSRTSLPANTSSLDASNESKSTKSNTKNCTHHPNDHLLKIAQNSSNEGLAKSRSNADGEQSSSSCTLLVDGHPATSPPLIKVTAPPASNLTPSHSYPGGLFKASDKAVLQTTSADDASTRLFVNGGSGSTRRSPEPSITSRDLLGSHVSRHHQGRNLKMNRSLETDRAGDYRSSYNQEQRVLRTTYDDVDGCSRAISDTRQMLSSLLMDRNWILCATHSTSGSSVDLLRTRKELLAVICRRLVTDAKLMVAAAIRSRQDLINSLTAALHTFARVLDSCRLVVTALPLGVRRQTLLDDVLAVGDVFLKALSLANAAAGRGQNDPAMGLLMNHTAELAHSLGRLIVTIKSLDD